MSPRRTSVDSNSMVRERVDARDILRNLQGPLIVIDEGYRIAEANDAACTLYRMARGDMLGRLCCQVTHGVDVPCWQSSGESCPVKTTFESRTQTRVVHRHLRGGKPVFEEVAASPLRDSQGRCRYVIEEIRDVTALLQLEDVTRYLKAEIGTLRSIIPICCVCKKVREDDGYWYEVERYVESHSRSEFSHGYCPQCKERILSEERHRMRTTGE